MGNLLTDKYAEGYPGHRFYAGCDNVDAIEAEAAQLACELFGAEHAYVQPHSGADANLVAFLAILPARVQATPLARRARRRRTSSQGRRASSGPSSARALDNQRLLGARLLLRRPPDARLPPQHLQPRSSMSTPTRVDRETKLLDLDELRAQAREVQAR